MSAINAVVEIGTMAIPGGQIVGAGMSAGIQAAKLAAYTYDAGALGASAFSNWASGGMCGFSHLPEDVAKAFQIMNDVTPAVLPKGSLFKDKTPPWAKGKGKGDDQDAPSPTTVAKPTDTDPPATTNDAPTTATNPTTADNPTTTTEPGTVADGTKTSDSEQSTTESRTQCSGLNKRAGDCKETVHITKIKQSKPGHTTTIKKTCDASDYPQACAHYYSAMTEGKMASLLTCEDEEQRADAEATKDWTKQHNNAKKWQDFTRASYMFRGKQKDVKCQADEWPPAYLLPNDEAERKKPEWGQLIRWLPSEENGGAANKMWAGFCQKRDGGKGKGQRVRRKNSGKGGDDENGPDRNDDGDNGLRDAERSEVNKGLVELGQQSKVQKRENRGTVTEITEYDEATFTRAVMSMEFDWNDEEPPSKDNDWWLRENPCWPKDILSGDPGFVLLTDDPWYATANLPEAVKEMTKSYAHDPSPELVREGERVRAQSGDKRAHSPDNSDSNKGPKNDRRFDEKLEVVDDVLVIRDDVSNNTRRATEEDLRDNVEVIHCVDRTCSGERKRFDVDSGFVFLPGSGPPSTPASNVVAATTVASTFTTLLTQASSEKWWARHEAPKVTAASLRNVG